MTERVRYLLDTNVLSEIRKKKPDERVLQFLTKANPNSLFVSCLSIGELKKGAAHKARSDASAGKVLNEWIATLESDFADRVLEIDTSICSVWGQWSAQRTRPVIDTLLAATAIIHGLTLVTRNAKDIDDLPVAILNPWDSK